MLADVCEAGGSYSAESLIKYDKLKRILPTPSGYETDHF